MDYSKLFDTVRDIYADFSYNNKEGKAIIPLRYFFELTYRCNLNCPYCYVGSDRTKNELSTEDWFNIIKQMCGNQCGSGAVRREKNPPHWRRASGAA